MPVPISPPWRSYDDDATRELFRTLHEMQAAIRADLRAQADHDAPRLEHLLTMQESRIRMHVFEQRHEVTRTLHELEQRRLEMWMWVCIAAPVLLVLLASVVGRGK